MSKKLYRVRDEKRVSGVCGGLANYFGIDPVVVRLLWAVLTVLTGGFIGILLYVICVFVIPQEPEILDGYSHEQDEDRYH